MKKQLLLFFVLCGCVEPQNHDDVMRIVVHVGNGAHTATAFFVGDSSIILTAKHSVIHSNTYEVYLESRVGKKDRRVSRGIDTLMLSDSADIAIISPTQYYDNEERLELCARDMQVGDNITIVGYPGGDYHVSTGKVIWTDGDRFRVDAQILCGASGAPVILTYEWCIVGIVTLGYSSDCLKWQDAGGWTSRQIRKELEKIL